MATPRNQLVDAQTPMFYHITSRCVQSAWLMGRDPVTRVDYSHRKAWLISRIESITPAFAVSVETYAVMSNHFHLVVYYDPLAASRWCDEEVARRWYIAHPSQLDDANDPECLDAAIERMLDDQERIDHCRKQLGSLSEFMKCLKQPIAYRANRESDTDGSYWAKRFYSGAILSEGALAAVMAYVDLNPIRAKIVRRLEDCRDTGLASRIQANEFSHDQLQSYLKPCADGLESARPESSMSLGMYLKFLKEILEIEANLPKGAPSAGIQHEALTREERWVSAKHALRRAPRAIGRQQELANWLSRQTFAARELAMPALLYLG